MDAKKGGLGLVKSRRFGPLFATQFLGAFNDNVFKTALFVMIGFYGLGQNGVLPAGQMLNLGALLFILPYFLFSALSGQLGNKFDKAVLARWVKVLEIIIMAVLWRWRHTGFISGQPRCSCSACFAWARNRRCSARLNMPFCPIISTTTS